MGLLKYAAGSAAIVALACCHSAARAQSNSDQLPPVVVNPNYPSKPARQIRRDRDRRRPGPARPATNAPPPSTPQPAEVVVTADREPEPISRTGSSISVIKGETLATSNPGSLVDVLRTVPGVDISESGGPGSTTNIRLRGANTGQTLVMIDGIRINDPDRGKRRFRFLDVCAERHRADRSAERSAKRALWFGRDGRGRQHHHQEGYGPGAIQCPYRRRKLRHRGHQRIGDGLVGSRGRMRSPAAGSTATASPASAIVSRRSRPNTVRWNATVSTVSAARPASATMPVKACGWKPARSPHSRARPTISRPARSPTRLRAPQGFCSRSGDAPRSIRSAGSSPIASTYSTPTSIAPSTM